MQVSPAVHRGVHVDAAVGQHADADYWEDEAEEQAGTASRWLPQLSAASPLPSWMGLSEFEDASTHAAASAFAACA